MPSAKLRASCDSCHYAKVKCEKVGQSCLRCLKLQEECSYSPVLPRTYQRRSDKLSAEIQSSSGTNPDPILTECHVNTPRPGQNLASADMNPMLSEFQGSADAYAPSMTPRLANQDHKVFLNDLFEPQWHNIPTDSSDFMSLSDFDCQDVGLQAFHRTTSSTASTSTAQLEDNRSNTVSASTPSDPQTSGLDTLQMRSVGADALPYPTDVRQPADSLEGRCSCLSGILAATHQMGLHDHSKTLKLDRILCSNRAMIEQCLAGLNCACHKTKNPSFSSDEPRCMTSCQLIAGGLLDRMIMVYQRATHEFCTTIESESTIEMDSQQGERGHEATGTKSRGPQLRLGDFAVEKGDQVTYTKRIVATEVDKLKKVVTNLDNTTQDGSWVIGALQQYLLRRCNDAVREIMK